MGTERLISIIVPIYNVEQYLDRCVQSIVGQTYPNIEILLIDDGSTDGSGKIAEKWAQQDSRIRVLRRRNGGLSAARNSGIEIAQGSHLVFVDSDDWIHPDMIEALVKRLDKAEIVCCGMIRATDTWEKEIEWFQSERVVSNIDAVKLLVENSGMTSHIQKNIFPRYVFDGIRFPEGKVFEDIRTAHKLFLAVNRICIIPGHYYYYYERNNSISNVVKLKNRIEWFDALEERENDLENLLTPDEKCRTRAQRAVVISLAMVQNRFTDMEKAEYKERMDEIMQFLRWHETNRAVKRYATRTQYIYYRIARAISFSGNTLYRLAGGRKW